MATAGDRRRVAPHGEQTATARVATTYNAAADSYDHAANSFWDRFGQRTIERLDLKPGQRVLDVCCGSGASAIPAAAAVGASGSVLGVDLAENLLALARAKGAARELSHLQFCVGDMRDLRLAEHGYDAVVCVFGIFFVPDMVSTVSALWRLVAPGGVLAITTWGPRFLEPMSAAFWDAVAEVRPDLLKGFNPWDRICEPEAVRALLASAGANDPRVALEPGIQPLRAPSDWWAMVLGTGYRATIEALATADRVFVERHNLAVIDRAGVQAVETNVVYAVARRLV